MATDSKTLDRSILIATALAEAIQALGEVPSGHLYVRVQQHVDIHTYQLCINFLVDQKLVKRDNMHLLTWIGPKAVR